MYVACGRSPPFFKDDQFVWPPEYTGIWVLIFWADTLAAVGSVIGDVSSALQGIVHTVLGLARGVTARVPRAVAAGGPSESAASLRPLDGGRAHLLSAIHGSK